MFLNRNVNIDDINHYREKINAKKIIGNYKKAINKHKNENVIVPNDLLREQLKKIKWKTEET